MSGMNSSRLRPVLGMDSVSMRCEKEIILILTRLYFDGNAEVVTCKQAAASTRSLYQAARDAVQCTIIGVCKES